MAGRCCLGDSATMDLAKRPVKSSSSDLTALLEEMRADKERHLMKKGRPARVDRRRRRSGNLSSLSGQDSFDFGTPLERSKSGTLPHSRSWRLAKMILGIILGLFLVYMTLRSTYGEAMTISHVSNYFSRSQQPSVEHRKMMDAVSLEAIPQAALKSSSKIGQSSKTTDSSNSGSDVGTGENRDREENEVRDTVSRSQKPGNSKDSEDLPDQGSGDTTPAIESKLGRKGGQRDKGTAPSTPPEAQSSQEQATKEAEPEAKTDLGWQNRGEQDPLLAAFMGDADDAVTVSGVIDPHSARVSAAKKAAQKKAIQRNAEVAAQKLLKDQEVAEKRLQANKEAARITKEQEVSARQKLVDEKAAQLVKDKEAQAEQQLKAEQDLQQKLKVQQEAEQQLKIKEEAEKAVREEVERKQKEENERQAREKDQQEAREKLETELIEEKNRKERERAAKEVKLQEDLVLSQREKERLEKEEAHQLEQLKQIADLVTASLKKSGSEALTEASKALTAEREHDTTATAQQAFMEQLAASDANYKAEIAKAVEEVAGKMEEDEFWNSEAGKAKQKEQAELSAKLQQEFMRRQEELLPALRKEIEAASAQQAATARALS